MYIRSSLAYEFTNSTMRLSSGSHLAYCTNVHRGNSWSETFDSLNKYVLEVKKSVCPTELFAIGLRLSAQAAMELSEKENLLIFQKWMEKEACYIFTINGFPYGNFHGKRVKEEVYQPDWTSSDRLEYTLLLFELLEKLLDPGSEGSVSSLPGSFKEFHRNQQIPELLFQNLSICSEKIESLGRAKNLDLHLGLEPEPFGLFETTEETLTFFEKLRETQSDSEQLIKRIGVNYDCCHLAIEFEDASSCLCSLEDAGIRLSKVHLSSALSVRPTPDNLVKLKAFVEDVYLHQVVIGKKGKIIRRVKDLDLALNYALEQKVELGDEWRIHFHIPLHDSPMEGMQDTRNHVLETLDWLSIKSDACRHLEMETYTWEVLPPPFQSNSVVEQVAQEYAWTLEALSQRGIVPL